MNATFLFFALLVFIAAVLFGGFLTTKRKIAELRAKGIYPADGDEKHEHVLRLLSAGEKVLAIRCYQAVHKVSLREAKDQVEKLAAENATDKHQG